MASTVAVVGALGWVRAESSEEWAVVERGSLVLETEAVGELEAIDAEVLGPPLLADFWEFKIQYLAPEGKEVQRGEPVIGFDGSELERRLAEARGRLEESVQQLEKRRADFEQRRLDAELEVATAEADLRKAALKVDVPADLVAARELSAAKIDRQAAERALSHHRGTLEALADGERAEVAQLEHRREQARAEVSELERALASLRVPAPRAGTVVYIANWMGEKPKVGDAAWRGRKVVTVPDLGRLRGVAWVPEVELSMVRVGQRVRLRLDAHPDEEFQGAILKLARTVQRKAPNNPEKAARAEIELDRIDVGRMRPGMRFRAEIERLREAGVLHLPEAAIRQGSEGPWLERDGWFGSEIVRPELGRRWSGRVEIVSGLELGARVRLSPKGSAR